MTIKFQLSVFLLFFLNRQFEIQIPRVYTMSDELCPPPVDDDDLTLPRASINKMIKELVCEWRDF